LHCQSISLLSADQRLYFFEMARYVRNRLCDESPDASRRSQRIT
jgi:hypothetical protein